MSAALARPLLRAALRSSTRRTPNTARFGLRSQSTTTTTASTASSTTQSAQAASETAQKTARSAAETAQAAQTVAKDAAAKAAQSLSRLGNAAGPVLTNAAKNLSGTLNNVGGRTGQAISLVEKQTPFLVYYFRVFAEISKTVFHAQKMSPPSWATIQSYYQTAWNYVRSGQLLTQYPALVQQARTLSKAQMAALGVVAAECLGFFTVGEMIGRFKLVGYRGEVSHAGHH